MTTTDARETLPRWDLDSLFPGPESPELLAAMERVARATADLEMLFDQEGIGVSAPHAIDDALVTLFEDVVQRYNDVLDRAQRIEGYLYCLTAADVRDEAADGAASAWRQRKVDFARLAPRFVAWVGQLDLDALAVHSDLARGHLPAMQRLQTAAAHLMPPGEEALAAALEPSGATGWMSLRDGLAGRSTARVEIDGEVRELPMSEVGNLAYHEDREVRRRGADAARGAWRELAIPLTAALNGVKGQQLALTQRRGWADPLDQACFANAIDRATLDALQTATREAIPDFRRYLHAKAQLLGLPVLASYDLFAPVGEAAPWPYETSRAFITETFAAEHPRLGEFAARAFAESWIDAEPREGKDGGGFSASVGGDASRIFMNYLPVYELMSVLAHELGHSYQNLVVAEAGRTPLQSPPDDVPAPASFPMTLAETASTICEALMQRAARAGATPAQEAALIDGWLQSFSSLVFGIHARFEIEREMFARRQERELSAAELEEITASSWHDLYGNAIDPGTVSVTDWTKPHFFIADLWYYNFPYAFGVLFAVGLLAVRDRDPDGFYDRFDALLADSGMCDAADLAARFGIDLRDPAFWRASLDSYRAEVSRLEELSRVLGS
jgi:oligoendopeptidase F